MSGTGNWTRTLVLVVGAVVMVMVVIVVIVAVVVYSRSLCVAAADDDELMMKMMLMTKTMTTKTMIFWALFCPCTHPSPITDNFSLGNFERTEVIHTLWQHDANSQVCSSTVKSECYHRSRVVVDVSVILMWRCVSAWLLHTANNLPVLPDTNADDALHHG